MEPKSKAPLSSISGRAERNQVMSRPKVVAIIQARMDSSRLPGKVLLDLGGKTVLDWVVQRVSRVRGVDQTIVATSTAPEDDAIAGFCEERGYAFTRGDLHDVLDRYMQAANKSNADVIIRITGDCPLIDPGMISDNLNTFFTTLPPLDFAANRLPGDRTIPIGLDAEICTRGALETAWREATEPHQREHVMPFFYENPERFRILHIRHEPSYGHLRWTLDTQEDYVLLQKIVSSFDGDDFSWKEALELFLENPQLAEINAGVSHKSQFDVEGSQP
ncbi:MAG: cytidylyltransferase domain-containing protein [Anaerolineales bacterium]